jgi:hypothetical protein
MTMFNRAIRRVLTSESERTCEQMTIRQRQEIDARTRSVSQRVLEEVEKITNPHRTLPEKVR